MIGAQFTTVAIVVLSAVLTISVAGLALSHVAGIALQSTQIAAISLLGLALVANAALRMSKRSSLPDWLHVWILLSTIACLVLVSLHLANVGASDIMYAFEAALPTLTIVGLVIAASTRKPKFADWLQAQAEGDTY